MGVLDDGIGRFVFRAPFPVGEGDATERTLLVALIWDGLLIIEGLIAVLLEDMEDAARPVGAGGDSMRF